MRNINRFLQMSACATLAFATMPSLHAQAANNNAKPAGHSGNMIGNHKDVMSTAQAPGSGNGGTPHQASEVRTEKFKVKQEVGSTAAPVDDTDPARHHPHASTAAVDDNDPARHHVPPASAVTAPEAGGAGSTATGTNAATGTGTPQVEQQKFKQEFGPTQVNKKN